MHSSEIFTQDMCTNRSENYQFSSIPWSSQTADQQLWEGRWGWYQSKESAAAQIPFCTCRQRSDAKCSIYSSLTRITSTQTSRNTKNALHPVCVCVCVFPPVYSVVSVFGVFAVRVQEDVFVYAPTEAEHVRSWMFTGLQHLQHHSESLLPVSGTVPPTCIYTWTLARTANYVYFIVLLCNFISGRTKFFILIQS